MNELTARDQAELICALDELLMDETTGEAGECPWCGAIRAEWTARVMRSEHDEACPYGRLRPLFARLVADDAPPLVAANGS